MRHLLIGFLLLAPAAYPQTTATTVVRDPQAVAVLIQVLSAVGGGRPISSIQNFTASGTITYYWAGKEVSGPATVSSRGSDEFRLDSQLPEGMRSLVVNHGHGRLRDVSGRIADLSDFNAVNIGILTFPYITLAASLADPLTSVARVGSQAPDPQVYQIRVQCHLPQLQDPGGALSRFCVRDYFIDSLSGLIVRVSYQSHADYDVRKEYPVDVVLEDYAGMTGVNFPRTIRQKLDGQTIWELRLSSVNLNVGGLTDSDFDLQ